MVLTSESVPDRVPRGDVRPREGVGNCGSKILEIIEVEA